MSIVLDTDMRAMAEEMVNDGIAAIEEAWSTSMVPFANDVRAKTPRRTGYLRGRWQSAITRQGFTWRMSIFNDADYAPYVVIKKWGSKNVAKTLLFDPADALADTMILLIGDHLAKDGM